MGGFTETQHRCNPDGTFADMGNTRLKAACGTANARPDFSGIDLRERNFSFHDLSAADLHDADLRACEFWHTNLRGAKANSMYDGQDDGAPWNRYRADTGRRGMCGGLVNMTVHISANQEGSLVVVGGEEGAPA